MGQRYDIECYKNETYTLTLEYTDSLNNPITLDTTAGTLTIRPLNDNSSTPSVAITARTTSVPVTTSTFYYIAAYPNRVILFLSKEDLSGSPFSGLTVGQKYFYDIIVKRAAVTNFTPASYDRIMYGYFTLNTGIS